MALIIYKEDPAGGKQTRHKPNASYYCFKVFLINSLGGIIDIIG